MAHVATHAPVVAPASGFFSRMMAGYRQWRDVRRTISELSEMSDAQLNDIGISRGEIYFVAHGGDRA